MSVVYHLKPDGIIAAAYNSGFSYPLLQNDNYFTNMLDLDKKPVEQVLTLVKSAPNEFFVSIHRRTVNNVALCVEASFCAQCDAKMRCTAVIVTERDITAEIMQIENLHKQLQNSVDVMYTLNSKGVFQFITPTCYQLWGFTPDELKDQCCWDMFEQYDRLYILNLLEHMVKTGDTGRPINVTRKCKSGQTIREQMVMQIRCDSFTHQILSIQAVSRQAPDVVLPPLKTMPAAPPKPAVDPLLTLARTAPDPKRVDETKPKRKLKLSPSKQPCKSCGVTQSLEWRKGAEGIKNLCNACGLRYTRAVRVKPVTETTPIDAVPPKLDPVDEVPA